LRCRWGLLPEGFDGFVIDAIARLAKDDSRHFAVVEPSIERFEPGNLLDDLLGDPSRSPGGDDVQIVGEEPEHALLLEAACEFPHCLGMGLCFLGPLHGRAPLAQDEGADELITPLYLINKVELELGKVTHRFPSVSSPQVARTSPERTHMGGACRRHPPEALLTGEGQNRVDHL
jgi:hypothetical protein